VMFCFVCFVPDSVIQSVSGSSKVVLLTIFILEYFCIYNLGC
jgi:hypothetical protein